MVSEPIAMLRSPYIMPSPISQSLSSPTNSAEELFRHHHLANGSHVVETVYVVDGVERRATLRVDVAN
jgi:hypothetical protein